jgi:hypothetical protein
LSATACFRVTAWLRATVHDRVWAQQDTRRKLGIAETSARLARERAEEAEAAAEAACEAMEASRTEQRGASATPGPAFGPLAALGSPTEGSAGAEGHRAWAAPGRLNSMILRASRMGRQARAPSPGVLGFDRARRRRAAERQGSRNSHTVLVPECGVR